MEVDVDLLTGNARALADLASPAVLGAVVKADGYGHGLEMAARCAVAGGAGCLCVADVSEAIRLRSDGYLGRVFSLYPVPAPRLTQMADLGVEVTLGSLAGIEEAGLRLDGRTTPVLGVHLEIDTGMTRGGIDPSHAVEMAAAVIAGEGTRLGGVWSHLAAPEDETFTAMQLGRFRQVVEILDRAGVDPGEIHVAASGGLLVADIAGHTLVRPGLAYYGAHPGAGPALPEAVRPALAVRAHPVRLAEVGKGTKVGYAGTWVAPTTSLIATLPLGYADGWSRASSPGSMVLVEGVRAPVVGRISSDSLMVDVTAIGGVSLDSEFTLLGRDGDDEIDADEVARVRGTISWEVLQQLGSRLSRVYMGAAAAVALRPESSPDLVLTPGVPRY